MLGRPSFLCLLLLTARAALPATAAPDYGRLPLSFEANSGQVDPAVRFLSRGRGYTLFLTSSAAVLRLSGPRHEATVVRMQLAGGKKTPHIAGLDPLATKSNYLLGNDPSRWRIGVPHYARVRYEAVYPGIDLIYHGSPRLEYDFLLAPGADPQQIRLDFSGVDAVTIGARGELVLRTAQGDFVQPPPVVYQEAGRERQQVEGRYVVQGARVSFAIGRYDRRRPLMIDPVLVYSSFLGGGKEDSGCGIAVDGAGNAYISTRTDSLTFPGVNAGSIQPANANGNDVVVTKINSRGTAIIYSTFLGGNSDDDVAGIAVDQEGNAYMTGWTFSTTFSGVNAGSIQPSHNGPVGFVDGFVIKINASGTAIAYATFLGGFFGDRGEAIAVDNTGNAIVTGETNSGDFPGQSHPSGTLDVFVTKINPAGTAIVYSAFLGGSDWDEGHGIAVDASGSVYVTGFTFSPNFSGVGAGSIQPTHGGGGYEAFVSKINSTGTATVYSTFLGGAGADIGSGIAVDAAGNAYVTGTTSSALFPGVGIGSIQSSLGGDVDAFVTKINPSGSTIVYSTFLGGISDDSGNSIAVDGTGGAFVAGTTWSSVFPGIDDRSIQPVIGGQSDAFVARLNPAGTAIDSATFIGGRGGDSGLGLAIDKRGGAYVTGQTNSDNFPGVTAGSIQPARSGGNDGFVVKVDIASIVTVPTLAPRAVALMALLLAALGLLTLKRKRGGFTYALRRTYRDS